MLIEFDDTYFMKEALKQANEAFQKDEVPVGAVVVADKTIIARAHNMTETLQDVTAHAEMLAITAAANHLGSKYLRDGLKLERLFGEHQIQKKDLLQSAKKCFIQKPT